MPTSTEKREADQIQYQCLISYKTYLIQYFDLHSSELPFAQLNKETDRK